MALSVNISVTPDKLILLLYFQEHSRAQLRLSWTFIIYLLLLHLGVCVILLAYLYLTETELRDFVCVCAFIWLLRKTKALFHNKHKNQFSIKLAPNVAHIGYNFAGTNNYTLHFYGNT